MKLIKKTMIALFAVGAFASCKKQTISNTEDAISPAVQQKVAALGFNTTNIQKVDEGYLVEGDIILTENDLNGLATTSELVYANEEHYRTTNLVTGLPRTITVSISSGAPSYFSTALNTAIARYNALNLRLRFTRVTSGGQINVSLFYQVSNTLGSAGFPSGGNPFRTISMNTYWYNSSTNVNYLASIIAHEMGHCIGYRHTDYMNRSYSCGGTAVNEGSAGVGAIYISGTPSGPSANSWMLACSNGSDRPFTSADQTALRNVYQ
jgi:hypothetical protein